MDSRLISRFDPLVRRRRSESLHLRLAATWAIAAGMVAAIAFLLNAAGWAPPFGAWWIPLLIVAALGAGALAAVRHRSRDTDYVEAARLVEARHPDLNGLLLTAVEQVPADAGQHTYLQHLLVQQAIDHGRLKDWADALPRQRVRRAQWLHAGAVALMAGAFALLWRSTGSESLGWTSSDHVAVTPGNATLERGESLVVLGRFGGALPAEVNLVERRSGELPKTIPLVKSLADPVFGASLPNVDKDLTYHLEYGGRRTAEYRVTVFERPRLEQADAVVTYPAYTALAPKRTENTRRVSAVEGSRLELSLRLNKPVASATLVAADGKKTAVPLSVTPGKATAVLPDFPLVATQTYTLSLVDADGRTNLQSPPFVFDVLPDRPPEIRLTTPRGDLRPSPVEEIGFSGTVSGAFGLKAYGIAYTVAGGETSVVQLGQSVPPSEKRAFSHTIALETLGVKPDQLVSWYAWADDTGPDGRTRRTSGDMFFCEIRPFDEIFRENKSMGGDEQGGEDGQGQGGSGQRLTEIEKQIIGATWKLQRNPKDPKFADDEKVVRESQAQAGEQAAKSAEEVDDPRTRGLWNAAIKEMSDAAGHLRDAATDAAALAPALASEQSAYQALLRLMPRSTQVTQGRGRGQGSGANQGEINQLDLTQEQNRYETERQATAAGTPEHREQLQVMNRLQELARRQQDVNDRLKELQTALQEARGEAEREELRKQLKRLEEEQQRMLADVDELRQRLDRPEDQSAVGDQRARLDQMREEVNREASAASQGDVANSLAAGTRAERQLQGMRDDLHRSTSSQFADDLRELRGEARDLAEREKEIARNLSAATATGAGRQKRLSDSADDGGSASQLDDQKKRMAGLVERAKQLSQQAELSEPLVSEKLYDSLRRLAQDDSGTVKEFQQALLEAGLMTRALNDRLNDKTAPEGTKALDLASGLVQSGYMPQAGDVERRAREGIDRLREGVDQAAGSVVGDDTAALRLARSELDAVAEDVKREAEAAGGAAGGGARPGGRRGQASGDPAAGAQASDDRTASGRSANGRATDGRTGQPGKGGGQGDAPGNGSRVADAGAQRKGDPSAEGKAPADANPGAVANEIDSLADAGNAGSAGGGATGGGAADEGTAGGGATGGGAVGGDTVRGGALGGGTVRGGAISRGYVSGSPILGGGYGAWADRLRDVENVVDSPDLRNAIAGARERARLLRQDYTRDAHKPDWAQVRREVVDPLVEVRNAINDELARRDSKDSLAPIDRDPVPNRYAESVRKYYEALGGEEGTSSK